MDLSASTSFAATPTTNVRPGSPLDLFSEDDSSPRQRPTQSKKKRRRRIMSSGSEGYDRVSAIKIEMTLLTKPSRIALKNFNPKIIMEIQIPVTVIFLKSLKFW